jgi:hypothetical protein
MQLHVYFVFVFGLTRQQLSASSSVLGTVHVICPSKPRPMTWHRMGSGRVAPKILELDTRYSGLPSCTAPLWAVKGLGGLQSQSEGTWRSSCLKHCATSLKVAGSIPDGVIGIVHWHNLSGRTMALGLTQPQIEKSTRNISWGIKTAGAQGWQPYHLHVPTVLKSGSLNLLEPCGSCPGL